MVVLLLLLGCTGGRPQTAAPIETPPAELPKQLRTRQVVVTLAPATPEQWALLATALAHAHDVQQVGAFPLASIGVQCLVFQVPTDRALEDVIQRLAADPRVESVQLNQVFHGLATLHNDPYANLQYGAQAIRADRAHPRATGKGVQVAVVDTGVDVEHPDLAGRVIKTANFVDGGEQTFQQDRHGTAVAGVIAARADNAVGIFGIAPEAELIAVKACWHRTPSAPEALCSSWTLAKAIDFVLHTEARVLNLSLAGPPDALLSRLLSTAVTRGITVSAAVLEDETRWPGFPASLHAVLATRASNPQGQVQGLPRQHNLPLLVAPGIDIITTTPHQTYDFLSGSSLAAAHVSGVVALLLEHAPQLTPARIQTLLRTAAAPPPPTAFHSPRTFQAGLGVVDACSALEQLLYRPICQ